MPWKPRKRKCRQKSTGKTGSYAVVKIKDGDEEQVSCHTSEEKAKSSIRAKHANENILREYIKGIIFGFISSPKSTIPIPHPPNESIEEIKKVIDQYKNKTQPPELQYHLDENVSGLFNNILINNGIPSRLMEINVLKKEISPTVIELKKLFNRERPSVVAKSFNIDWVGDVDQMSTTNSPSYPSGHTAQAYWIAYHLSDDFPVFSSHFFSLAERVAQSRVDRGVHFPSD